MTLTNTLAPASGALVFAATNATNGAIALNGGTIDFGAAEGVITVTDTAGATIQGVIKGTNGLTIGGFGSLTLSGTANTFTGPVMLNGANAISSAAGAVTGLAAPVLAIAADGSLGNVNNGLVFGGGTLKFNAANITLAATRPVTLTLAGGTFDTSVGNSTVAGAVGGAGGLNKIGANTLTLNNAANNYSGLTNVYGGTLVTNSGPREHRAEPRDDGAVRPGFRRDVRRLHHGHRQRDQEQSRHSDPERRECLCGQHQHHRRAPCC